MASNPLLLPVERERRTVMGDCVKLLLGYKAKDQGWQLLPGSAFSAVPISFLRTCLGNMQPAILTSIVTTQLSQDACVLLAQYSIALLARESRCKSSLLHADHILIS